MSKSALFLIVPVAILFSFGLLMIFNTTAAQIMDRSLDANTHSILLKQSLYGILGLIAGGAIFCWGYESFLKFSIPALVFGTILLVLLFVPGIGQTVNGARRWIGLWGFTFQPSECIKILLPAVYIHWACQKKEIPFIPFLKT